MSCLRGDCDGAALDAVRAALDGPRPEAEEEAVVRDVLADAEYVPGADWAPVACQKLAAYRAVVDATPRGSELSERLDQARGLFRAGLYFEVHEVLEPPWMKARGAEKAWLQGLIQAAVAWHHCDAGNRRGARSLADAAGEKLLGAPETWQGFEMGCVRRAVEELGAWLDAPEERTEPYRPFRGRAG